MKTNNKAKVEAFRTHQMKVIGEDPKVLKNGRCAKKVTEEKMARYYH